MTDPVELVTYAQLVEANEILRGQLNHSEHQVLVMKNAFCDLQERIFNDVGRTLTWYETDLKKRYGVEVEPQFTGWRYSRPDTPGTVTCGGCGEPIPLDGVEDPMRRNWHCATPGCGWSLTRNQTTALNA